MTHPAPLVLGFDTSTSHCAAALTQGDQVLASRREEMSKGQAERLVGLLQDVLDEAEKSFDALDAIGVGIGPGNFTGIRIAVSAARGLALGLNIPAVGVSSFDALQLGTTPPCAAIVDARRGQVFMQSYDIENSSAAPSLVTQDDLLTNRGPIIGTSEFPARYPTAVAIALLASKRYWTTTDRPAPLYLRPADAAPARDAAPNIL